MGANKDTTCSPEQLGRTLLHFQDDRKTDFGLGYEIYKDAGGNYIGQHQDDMIGAVPHGPPFCWVALDRLLIGM